MWRLSMFFNHLLPRFPMLSLWMIINRDPNCPSQLRPRQVSLFTFPTVSIKAEAPGASRWKTSQLFHPRIPGAAPGSHLPNGPIRLGKCDIQQDSWWKMMENDGKWWKMMEHDGTWWKMLSLLPLNLWVSLSGFYSKLIHYTIVQWDALNY